MIHDWKEIDLGCFVEFFNEIAIATPLGDDVLFLGWHSLGTNFSEPQTIINDKEVIFGRLSMGPFNTSRGYRRREHLGNAPARRECRLDLDVFMPEPSRQTYSTITRYLVDRMAVETPLGYSVDLQTFDGPIYPRGGDDQPFTNFTPIGASLTYVASAPN